MGAIDQRIATDTQEKIFCALIKGSKAMTVEEICLATGTSAARAQKHIARILQKDITLFGYRLKGKFSSHYQSRKGNKSVYWVEEVV